MKKIAIAFYILIALGILSGFIISVSETNKLNSRLRNSDQMIQQMETEFSRVTEEKEKLSKENEKLRMDAVEYLKNNTELQVTTEGLQKERLEKEGVLEAKEAELKKLKGMLIKMSKKNTELQSGTQQKIDKQKEELSGKIKKFESDLQKERALYNYNLGVAYSNAGLYDEAISAYKKSLDYNPNNAEAYYNLGVLFADFKNDPEEAVKEYKEYLRLKPDAGDKAEVEALIKELK